MPEASAPALVQEEEIREAQRRSEEEEAKRRQAEEDAKEQARLLAAEEEARRRAEVERKQEEERRRAQLKAEEEARRKQEEAAQARRAEEERLAKERRRRKDAVDVFLKANKFKGVSIAKKGMLSTTYPLHCAVEKGDVQMVDDLIQEGADRSQKNSKGRTPTQLAQKKDKQGSHAAILRKLEA